MGLREWWRDHRDLERGLRAQDWSLGERIVAHLVVDAHRSEATRIGRESAEEEVAWFDRQHEAAIRAGQMFASRWPLLDAGEVRGLEEQRRDEGWTGRYAEVAPPDLTELADARMKLFEAWWRGDQSALRRGAEARQRLEELEQPSVIVGRHRGPGQLDFYRDVDRLRATDAERARHIAERRAEDEARWEREGRIFEQQGLDRARYPEPRTDAEEIDAFVRAAHAGDRAAAEAILQRQTDLCGFLQDLDEAEVMTDPDAPSDLDPSVRAMRHELGIADEDSSTYRNAIIRATNAPTAPPPPERRLTTLDEARWQEDAERAPTGPSAEEGEAVLRDPGAAAADRDEAMEAAERGYSASAAEWMGMVRAGQFLEPRGQEELSEERRAQGWTGAGAEIPPAHLAEEARRHEEGYRQWFAETFGGPGDPEMGTPWDYRAELARELIDRYGADRMHEVVQRLEEMPLHEVAQVREHEEMPDELRAALDERIDRASTEAVREFLRVPEQEDGLDGESGITAVEGGGGEWLDYRDPEMEAPITAVDDGDRGMPEHGGEQRETEEECAEAIVDVAVRPELADAIARPSEAAMGAQDALQAEASTGAEMSAEPGGLEPSGGIQYGVGR